MQNGVLTRVITHGSNTPDTTFQRAKAGAYFYVEIQQQLLANGLAINAVRNLYTYHVIHFVAQVTKRH